MPSANFLSRLTVEDVKGYCEIPLTDLLPEVTKGGGGRNEGSMRSRKIRSPASMYHDSAAGCRARRSNRQLRARWPSHLRSIVSSAQGEGWRLIRTHYDDGGLSGATMERPALQRLMADIAKGLIDAVVVYKVDRLTRSLADFAKMVEVFDARGVSFVAVPQQFNTTTSMGRLTLNVLLSFAQFEREVTGERIRDKIAASKRKGIWMGGLVPLGYEVRERQLVINEAEATTVRHIFTRYCELGSVRLLTEELDRLGVRSKIRVSKAGVESGGQAFSRGALYTLLRNPIYVGEIRHKGVCHPGQHAPIIERAMWDKVAQLLRGHSTGRGARNSGTKSCVLMGKLFDQSGAGLTPSHAVKGDRRYRYYVSRSLMKGPAARVDGGWRLPAAEIERSVAAAAQSILDDQQTVISAIEQAGLDSSRIATSQVGCSMECACEG